jgi:hypothetical protein
LPHAVMVGRWSSIRGKVLAGVGIGVPARWITPDLADEVLAKAGLAGGGRFRALPARLGVYFVLGLCLHAGKPYREVLKELAAGLSGPLAAAGWQVPASTALTGSRRRLGEKPFELLFWQLCGALSPGTAPWSHICGLLAAAWDGTTVKAPASGPNITAFGQPRGKRHGHYPQVRLVTLIACGTRAVIGAAMGPLRGPQTGERALAAGLLGQLHPGMLLLADRGFYSHRLWQAAAARAHLLWRVQSSVHLPVITALPDGSWRSRLADPAASARRAQRNGKRRRRGSRLPPDTGPLPGITVRVIEFWLTMTTSDGRVRTERYRLITTLLDHRRYPASELAAGYAWRWAAETGFREFKTYLRGPGRILRSRTPELARQELWAYLIIYQAIRAVICLTAAHAGIDPGQISFTTTLHAIRRTLTTARTSPATALAETQASILADKIPQREGRVCIRAVTQPVSPFPSKARHKDPPAQHAHHTITIHPPHQPPRPSTSQAKPHPNHPTKPP